MEDGGEEDVGREHNAATGPLKMGGEVDQSRRPNKIWAKVGSIRTNFDPLRGYVGGASPNIFGCGSAISQRVPVQGKFTIFSHSHS